MIQTRMFLLIVAVLLPACAGCLEIEDAIGEAGGSFFVAGSRVITTYDYTLGKVSFVVVEVISPPATTGGAWPNPIVLQSGDYSIKIGDAFVSDIRGTNKLYIVHDDQLDVYNLTSTSETTISDALSDVPPATTVAAYLQRVAGAIGHAK